VREVPGSNPGSSLFVSFPFVSGALPFGSPKATTSTSRMGRRALRHKERGGGRVELGRWDRLCRHYVPRWRTLRRGEGKVHHLLREDPTAEANCDPVLNGERKFGYVEGGRQVHGGDDDTTASNTEAAGSGKSYILWRVGGKRTGRNIYRNAAGTRAITVARESSDENPSHSKTSLASFHHSPHCLQIT
jgi:hypothetical protein